jgi:DUF1680 family protein
MYCLSDFIPWNQVSVTGDFVGHIQELIRTEVLPYQWEALNDQIAGAEPSHCLDNFRAAAEKKGHIQFHGQPFQDSDIYKWIEAAAYTLAWHPDSDLEAKADQAIELICGAQQPDGYLNTYFILTGAQRWTHLLDGHELYCAGHLMEAAVAYYHATGKDKLLKAAQKLADHIADVFGTSPGKIPGYPGHPEVELALIRLFEATGNIKYQQLAQYFICQRGASPSIFRKEADQFGWDWADSPFQFQFYQAGKPILEQTELEGHAVRALYLCCGIADVAARTQDAALLETCRRLWEDLIQTKLYITGGAGSSVYGEAFTFAYDLPNDTAYAETCAAVAVCFFAQRMMKISPSGAYGDVLEQALYNGVLSGMALDGKSFFYVNPLEVVPEACQKDQRKKHVKPIRQKWFACACCPPNLARLFASIGGYLHFIQAETLYTNLYVTSTSEFTFQGLPIKLHMDSAYPFDEKIHISLSLPRPMEFSYAVRIPAWCADYHVLINGKICAGTLKDGFLYLHRCWCDGDEVELTLSMPVRVVRANSLVRENIGKSAICRGPIVYCMEQTDNGPQLHRNRICGKPSFTISSGEENLKGLPCISCSGEYLLPDGTQLYTSAKESFQPKTLRFIPYFAWCNRSPGEMAVWVRHDTI